MGGGPEEPEGLQKAFLLEGFMKFEKQIRVLFSMIFSGSIGSEVFTKVFRPVTFLYSCRIFNKPGFSLPTNWGRAVPSI